MLLSGWAFDEFTPLSAQPAAPCAPVSAGRAALLLCITAVAIPANVWSAPQVMWPRRRRWGSHLSARGQRAVVTLFVGGCCGKTVLLAVISGASHSTGYCYFTGDRVANTVAHITLVIFRNTRCFHTRKLFYLLPSVFQDRKTGLDGLEPRYLAAEYPTWRSPQNALARRRLPHQLQSARSLCRGSLTTS